MKTFKLLAVAIDSAGQGLTCVELPALSSSGIAPNNEYSEDDFIYLPLMKCSLDYPITHGFAMPANRLQFPVSCCYAQTIDRSMSQTLSVASIDTRTRPSLAPGLRYTAWGRVPQPNNILVIACRQKYETEGAVYVNNTAVPAIINRFHQRADSAVI